ncbi:MAG TPA: hypothetical protein VKE41_18405, partial [Roseiflexaceae bacterium]|nr:hypothetical protein [Roseiflexaceae bacterium]
MTRDPTNENTNLPPWLRDVPLPPRPRGAQERAGADTSGSAAPASPPPNESLPGWLRDSSADTAGPAIETPGWADSPAQTPAPPLAGDQAALPDWLRDTQSSMPASAPSEQLPSWLRDLAEPEAAAPEPAAPSTPASAAP